MCVDLVIVSSKNCHFAALLFFKRACLLPRKPRICKLSSFSNDRSFGSLAESMYIKTLLTCFILGLNAISLKDNSPKYEQTAKHEISLGMLPETSALILSILRMPMCNRADLLLFLFLTCEYKVSYEQSLNLI